MKSLNAKLVLSALSVVAIFATPAVAKKPLSYPRQHEIMSDPLRSGVGIYDVAPNYGEFLSPYSPTVTGGGSAGYNQSLHDDKW